MAGEWNRWIFRFSARIHFHWLALFCHHSNFVSFLIFQHLGLRNSYDRDYIGFATLPEQVHRKSVKRGFDFTLMVIGETGLGKSTLINSLFMGDLYKNRVVPSVAERLERTTQIEKKQMEIEERGVKLRLTIVDTPGFGDSVNSEESWRTVVSYIDDQVWLSHVFYHRHAGFTFTNMKYALQNANYSLGFLISIHISLSLFLSVSFCAVCVRA